MRMSEDPSIGRVRVACVGTHTSKMRRNRGGERERERESERVEEENNIRTLPLIGHVRRGACRKPYRKNEGVV